MSIWTRVAAGLDNPIVVKEAVSRMRSWRAPVVATVYLSLIGLIGFAFLNLGTAANSYSAGRPVAAVVGAQAFAAMAFFQLVLVCLFSPALAAGAISGERERQTLDVLLVSRVSAFGIVWGKLIASIGYVLLLILTALPLFSVVFLFGGIDFQQFLLSQVITIATALSLASIALFCSALFQRSLPATVASYAASFLLTIGTAVISFLVGASQAVNRVPTSKLQAVQAAQPVVAEWFFNPFYALVTVLQPSPAGRLTARGFSQLLFFGQPESGVVAVGGPQLDPWLITVLFEALLAIAALVGAVLLVRGRRAMRPRRTSEAAAEVSE